MLSTLHLLLFPLLLASALGMILIVEVSDSSERYRYRFDRPMTITEVVSFLRETFGSACRHHLYDVLKNKNIDETTGDELYSQVMAHVEVNSNHDLKQVLMIAGPLFTAKDVIISGHRIQLAPPTLRMDETNSIDGCTGLVTWDGAVVLAKYLEHHPRLVQGKTVLELGAGTGLAGISASLLGCELVLCTDLPYALESLLSNLHLNVAEGDVGTKVKALALDWTDPVTYPEPFISPSEDSSRFENRWDVILAADVVWLEHLVRPLTSTLVALSSHTTLLLLSYQVLTLFTFPWISILYV